MVHAPLAAEAVRRIDALVATERAINGLPAEQCLAVREQPIAPLVAALETWMREQRARMSRHAEVGQAMDTLLTLWDVFRRVLTDGRICLTNKVAEGELRDVALGRKAGIFAGSGRGGERAAARYSPITSAKLNAVDPRVWLADVLARIVGHPASRLHELLPWHWKASQGAKTAEGA